MVTSHPVPSHIALVLDEVDGRSPESICKFCESACQSMQIQINMAVCLSLDGCIHVQYILESILYNIQCMIFYASLYNNMSSDA
jgi:hypothetical protein